MEHTRQLQQRLRIGPKHLRYFMDSEDFLCRNDGTKELHLVTERADGSYIQSHATQHSNHFIKKELGVESFDFHSLRHTHATDEMQRQSLEIMNRMYQAR